MKLKDHSISDKMLNSWDRKNIAKQKQAMQIGNISVGIQEKLEGIYGDINSWMYGNSNADKQKKFSR